MTTTTTHRVDATHGREQHHAGDSSVRRRCRQDGQRATHGLALQEQRDLLRQSTQLRSRGARRRDTDTDGDLDALWTLHLAVVTTTAALAGGVCIVARCRRRCCRRCRSRLRCHNRLETLTGGRQLRRVLGSQRHDVANDIVHEVGVVVHIGRQAGRLAEAYAVHPCERRATVTAVKAEERPTGVRLCVPWHATPALQYASAT